MLIDQTNALNIVIMVIGIVSPLQSVPQLYTILREQSSASVSTLTYVLSATFNVAWFMYGLAYNSWPNIISGAGSCIVSTLIVIAIQVYRPAASYKWLPS